MMKRVDRQSLLLLVFKLFNSLKKRRKWQYFLLFTLMLFSTCTEVVSIGAVLPFIAMLTAPEKVYFHPYLKSFNNFFSIHSPQELIFPVTIFFVTVVIFSGIFRMLLLWLTNRLASSSGSELSKEVIKRVLYKPYLLHINQNSSEIINTMSKNVDAVIFGVILPSLTFINSVILLLAILISLLIIQPIVALSALITFGISYSLIAWYVQKTLKKNSKSLIENQTKALKVLQEGLGGIRDIILDGSQEVFIKIYEKADIPLRKSSSVYNFIVHFPRFSMETIGIIVIAFLALYLTQEAGSINKVLPILGSIGVGSQRILPVIQQLYTSWVSITGNNNQLADVIKTLDYPLPTNLKNTIPIKFMNTMEFSQISFRYNKNGPFVLNDINFIIKKGDRVGFIGTTGTGKSTLLDIVMGLLTPTSGHILIDGSNLNDDNLRAWQGNIAHVPQSIFLSDTTIADNIAFGVPPESIDYDRIKFAARVASASEFIESYPNNYETVVGERGINLSGGQRQRIGIARAIYKNANILVFDEATSALDNQTEKEVMKAITRLDANLTLLIIAHRLSSLNDCDYLIEVANGQITRHEVDQFLNNK